jgi:serine/threonine protein kinase
MDAMVAERLNSSPRTFDIYGFCGLGILSEFFHHGDIEDTVVQGEGYAFEDLQDEEKLKPQNDLDGSEKLVLALEMAEGISVLHGNKGGIIVHDDISLSQFLLNKDKSMLKINDFNRAEFMLWDENKQNYCKYRNGPGGGNVCI